MLAHGADGGILASSHLKTELFVAVYERMLANDYRGARAVWSRLETLVPLLFKEANPMPIKHCFCGAGASSARRSAVGRLRISRALADELERLEAGAADRAAE